MDRGEALDATLRRLSEISDETVNTSMRIPSALRDAAALAVEHLGIAETTTALTVRALRDTLETAVLNAALDEFARLHPESEPTLGEVAVALAQQLGSPLAAVPQRIMDASIELARRHPGADAHDVLLWCEARQAVA